MKTCEKCGRRSSRTFAEEVRDRRRGENIKVRDAARQCKISTAAYCRFESGRQPSVVVLYLVWQRFGTGWSLEDAAADYVSGP